MKNSKQMELIKLTSSQEDILANLSPLQVEKKVKRIRDTSGQSILDLSKNSNQLGLLEKMLVDTLNSVSTPLSRTWRVKTTPLGRLVFQLRASAPTTKEKESGLWRTPDAHGGRGPSSEKRMKMKLEKKMPISLNDQVAHPHLVPTPTARDHKDTGVNMNYEKAKKKGRLAGHAGGSLNPTWVEWLMGYPSGWTDLNHLETVSYHKSHTTLDSASSEVTTWPTPAARSFKLPRKPETMAKTKRNPLTNTLEDAVQHREMFPTPLSRDYKDLAVKPSWKEKKQKNLPVIVAERMWGKNDK